MCFVTLFISSSYKNLKMSTILYILFFKKFIVEAKSLAKKCGKIFIPYAKMRGCGDKLVT
jgi:hypothetical protein